jgi:hypothetical protein
MGIDTQLLCQLASGVFSILESHGSRPRSPQTPCTIAQRLRTSLFLSQPSNSQPSNYLNKCDAIYLRLVVSLRWPAVGTAQVITLVNLLTGMHARRLIVPNQSFPIKC